MSYIILSTRAVIRAGHLELISRLRNDRGKGLYAVMLQREMAALIPRFVLLGKKREADRIILETIQSIASRMTEGRRVKIRRCHGCYYYTFMNWREVVFSDTRSIKDTFRPEVE